YRRLKGPRSGLRVWVGWCAGPPAQSILGKGSKGAGRGPSELHDVAPEDWAAARDQREADQGIPRVPVEEHEEEAEEKEAGAVELELPAIDPRPFPEEHRRPTEQIDRGVQEEEADDQGPEHQDAGHGADGGPADPRQHRLVQVLAEDPRQI